MFTRREANERAAVNNGRIVFLREYGEYRVTLNEWSGKDVEKKAYYTDDLEDAVLTLGRMRVSA